MSFTLGNQTGTTTASANPRTQNFNVGAYGNPLVAMIETDDNAGGLDTAATYDGVAMTYVGAQTNTDHSYVQMWYLEVPHTGTCQFSVANPSTRTNKLILVSFVPSTGGAAIDTTANGAGTSANPSINVTGTSANSLMVGICTDGYRTQVTQGANYTSLYQRDAGNWTFCEEYDLDTGAAGTIAVNFVHATSDTWGIVAAAFKTASAPIPPITINLDAAQISVNGQSLSVSAIPNITVQLDEAHIYFQSYLHRHIQLSLVQIAVAGQASTISAPPPAIQVNLGVATLIATGQSITVDAGGATPQTINLSTAQINISGQTTAIYVHTDYYVDATLGDDLHPGTEAEPWKTLSKVTSSVLAPGDNVYFKRGEIWREYLIINEAGAEGYPITFGAYGTGSAPSICGADIEMSWTLYTGSVWQTSVAANPNVVIFNGTTGLERPTIEDVDSEFDFHWQTGTAVLYVYSAGGDPSTVYTDPGVEIGTRNRGIYTGGTNYIHYITLQDLRVYGVGSDWGNAIRAEQADHWNYSNLLVEQCGGFGILMGGCSYHHITNCTLIGIRTTLNPDAGGPGVKFYADGTTICHDILVDYCTINYWRLSGVELNGEQSSNRSYDSEVCYNDLSHNASGCYYIKMRNSTIHHNTCDDNLQGSTYGEEYGMAFETVSDCEVHHNTCTNGRVGMEIWAWTGGAWPLSGPGDNNKIHHNIFANNTRHGFLDFTGNSDNTELYTNKMYGNGYAGIHVDDNNAGYESTGCKCYNNTVYENGWSSPDGDIYVGSVCAGWTFRNNISYASNCPAFRVGAAAFGGVHDHNCYYRATGTVIDDFGTTYDLAHVTDWEATAVADNPDFVDPANDDYHLLGGSPCIDAGVDVGLTEDFDGNPIT